MALLAETKKTLTQLSQLLSNCSQVSYTQELELITGASIGKHVRHILEFYECLLIGIPMGTVNYDARERKLILEENPAEGINLIQSILQKIGTVSLQQPLRLTAQFSGSSSPTQMPTSVERELFYNLEHTIHHLAIINIAVRHYFPAIPLDENLGVAPSTLQYQEACAQ